MLVILQGRRQKNFQGATEKGLKNSKKDRKIALLSLYLYHVWKSRKGGARPLSADAHDVMHIIIIIIQLPCLLIKFFWHF